MKLQRSQWLRIGGMIAAVVILRGTVFGVDETEYVVVTTFGRPAWTVRDAGLHFKLPYQSRRSFDRRLLVYRFGELPFYTQDKKAVNMELYVVWRIADPLRFFQAVTDTTGAEQRLHNVVLAAATSAVGQVRLSNLINTDASELQTAEQKMDEVREQTDAIARSQFGIRVMDVRIQRIAFPKENQPAVFARMRAERERIARQYRAEGQEQALMIRAEADKEKERILSEAYRDAERIKGEGDAVSTQIYGAAHSADPQFYHLTRTLEAYRKVLDKDTTAILAADSELLRLLTQGRPSTTKK